MNKFEWTAVPCGWIFTKYFSANKLSGKLEKLIENIIHIMYAQENDV